MQDRYRIFRRAGGNFYARDRVTGKAESLATQDKSEARQLLVARNQAVAQPQLNRTLAKAYLSAKSPELLTRTWTDVMAHYVLNGVESTRDRKERAFRSRPFAILRTLKLVDTEAIHILTIIEHKQAGNSTLHYVRRLHNYALHLGWLLAPAMAEAAWPQVRKKKFTAITEDEHERIVAREGNQERKLYYQMLWETGGSQSDIACLNWNQIDREEGVIRFSRRKLLGIDGGDSLLRIGPRIKAILEQLPGEGALFPTFEKELSKHRSTEFWRRCKTLGIQGRNLHSYRYAWAQRARAAGSRRLRWEIVELSARHPRYGYRRITALLRREGWSVNAKRVQRVRRQEGFRVSKRQRKMRRVSTSTALRQRATRPGEIWSWDFVEDQTEAGSKLRILTLLDEYTRQCLTIHVGWSIRAVDVITVVEAAMARYGVPEHLRSDNGPEFIAYAIQDWLKERQVKAIYIKPGSPWGNGHIESFHDKLRDECLNRELFGSLLEAKVLVEQWRIDYNTNRPHSALRYQTPQEVADHWQTDLRASPCAASASTNRNINNRTELHF